MDLKQFKKEFDGKEVEDPKHKYHVLKSIRISDLGICGIDSSGWFCVRNFDDFPMETFKLYEPPKPEFDFKGRGFWAIVSLNLRFYDKIGICSWLAHCDSGHVYLCSKKTILLEATPCKPPKKGEGWDDILEALEENGL